MNLKPETFAVTVSQVNEYIKKIFSQDENLKYLMVKVKLDKITPIDTDILCQFLIALKCAGTFCRLRRIR